MLGWTAIASVSGWEVKQDSGSWTPIPDSAIAANHTATGLTGGMEYTFKVRTFVSTGDTLMEGIESGAVSVTPTS